MELKQLVDDALQALDVSPIVEVIWGRYLIVGDTHGYPEVSRLAFRLAEELSLDGLVFLGDYVDRGPRGLENLELLLGELVSGSRLILLRGNHETPYMNYNYGFYMELEEKGMEDIYNDLVEVFRRLPYIAVDRGSGLVMLHGGIPCRLCKNEPEEPYSLSEVEEGILEARRRGKDLDPVRGPAFHVLWNDPSGRIEWFSKSVRGAYLYGRRAWPSFLSANGFKVLVRAHEVADVGFIWRPDGSWEPLKPGWSSGIDRLKHSVVTVFSSLYHGSRAGLMSVEKGVVSLYATRGASITPSPAGGL